MKILYVSDNRVRGNYGCRATSTALSQLIRRKHEIVGVITGRFTNNNTNHLFFCKWFPAWIYKAVSKKRKNKYFELISYVILKKISKLFSSHYLGGPCDYLSLDFEQSIKNLKTCLSANPYLEEFDLDNYDFDAMVVNGEGSFIFSTPEWHWREAMTLGMLMYWAQKKGKRVYFLNAMLSDESTSERNYRMLEVMDGVLSKCEVVQVREEVSCDYAKQYLPNVKPIIKPDALFTWYPLVNDGHKVTNGKYYIPHCEEKDELYETLDFSKPYICVSGSSHGDISVDITKTIEAYTNLVQKLKECYKNNIYLVEVCEGDSFLREVSAQTECPLISVETPLVAAAKILANAEVFVSGRYHPSILASLGGTPCVFMGSNSHKTRSLQNLLQYSSIYEFGAIPSHDEIERIVEIAMSRISESRDNIKKRCKELCQEAETIVDLVK